MSETIVEYGETSVVEIYNKSKLVQINNESDYLFAAEFVKKIKGMLAKNIANLKPAKDAVAEREEKEIKPLKCAEAFVREKINNYLNDQEIKRRLEQSKAEAEAKAIADKEREKLLAQAIKAEEKGKVEKAEELIEKAEMIYDAPVIVPNNIPKTIKSENVSTTRRSDIKITIEDPMTVLKGIVAGTIPITVIDFKDQVLKAWIKSSGIRHVPGIHIQQINSVSIR